jgi:hypothetical protein
MDIPTNLPTDKIFQWCSALAYARIVLQHRVARDVDMGLSAKYEESCALRLEEMEDFLTVTWDNHVTALELRCAEIRIAQEAATNG